MKNGIPDIPPFSPVGEIELNDPDFEIECRSAINVALRGHDCTLVSELFISFHKVFGAICRVDFSTPDSSDEFVNRVMLWKLNSGELVKFVGFHIPDKPLKR